MGGGGRVSGVGVAFQRDLCIGTLFDGLTDQLPTKKKPSDFRIYAGYLVLHQHVGKTLIEMLTGTNTCSYKITLYFLFVSSPTAAILPCRLSTTVTLCTSLVIILRTIWCYYFFRLHVVVSNINNDIYFRAISISLWVTRAFFAANRSSKFARGNSDRKPFVPNFLFPHVPCSG